MVLERDPERNVAVGIAPGDLDASGVIDSLGVGRLRREQIGRCENVVELWGAVRLTLGSHSWRIMMMLVRRLGLVEGSPGRALPGLMSSSLPPSVQFHTAVLMNMVHTIMTRSRVWRRRLGGVMTVQLSCS